jgi:purine nucleosidase/pyrimidine-specific ribonucleoside hydrolase
MGGAFYVPGNVTVDESNRQNRVSEWNIWVDPLAASEVFASGIPIRLTPLDATNKINWKKSDADMWKSESTPEAVLAAKLLQWMLRSMSRNGVYVWDLVAAVNAVEPDLCEHRQVHVQVVTRLGDQDGRTIINKAAPPNATVCISPNEDAIKRHVATIFNRP